MSQDQPFRIFVGIKLAPDIAEHLARLALPLAPFSVRLVPPSDLHVTLVPPWNESEIAETVERLREASRDCPAFRLTLERLRYGPTQRQPRLLWVECRPAPEITRLKALLFQALGRTNEDGKDFVPHVTLARLPWGGRAIARQHPMDQELTLTQPVETVELFRSPKGSGRKGYEVLASIPLRGERGASAMDPVPELSNSPSRQS